MVTWCIYAVMHIAVSEYLLVPGCVLVAKFVMMCCVSHAIVDAFE